MDIDDQNIDLIDDNDIWDDEDRHLDRHLYDDDIDQKQSEIILALSNGSLGLDLGKDEDKTKFLKEYKPYFTGGKRGTLIHVALENCDDDKFDHLTPLFSLLIGNYPMLLEARNELGETTLHYAIYKRLSRVTKYLCECAQSPQVAKAISSRGRLQENCVHAAIRLRLEEDATQLLISICDTDALSALDSNLNTPLHLAMKKERLKWSEGRQIIVNTELQFVPDLEHVVWLLVLKKDEVLQYRNKLDRTPYQERLHQLARSGLLELKAHDGIATMLLVYCMKYFRRDIIMRCLYQRGHGMFILSS
jgi:ankyrin repeat protein